MQHSSVETETLQSGAPAPIENVQSASGDGSRVWARALGAVSLLLGAAAILAPRKTAELIGIPTSPTARRVLVSVGVRELGAAAGLFASERSRASWKWFRVAGDAIDLALLVRENQAPRADHRRLAGTLAVVSGITTLDVIAAVKDTRRAHG